MVKYRERPVVIEAEQYKGKPVHGMCTSKVCPVRVLNIPHVHATHMQRSEHGPFSHVIAVEVGDWVIPEPDGENFYTCKPDKFDELYEPVKDK
jgi:hypothetical protein